MKKNLTISVIILILILVGAFVYFKTQQNNVVPEAENVSQEIDTSDWETFRDDVLGIKFKHPKNCEHITGDHLYIENITSGIICGEESITYHSMVPIKNYEVYFQDYKNNVNFTVEDIANAFYKINLNDDSINKPENRWITPIKKMDFKYNAFEFSLDWGYSQASFTNGFWKKTGGSLLSEATRFIYIGNEDNNKILELRTKANSSKLIETILNSFEFID